MKLKNPLIILVLVMTSFVACTEDKGKNIPDVSHLQVDLKVHRIEKELFSIDTTNAKEELISLEQKYPDFCPVYFQNVLGIRPAALGDRYYETLRGFLTFPPARQLYDTTQQIYPSLEPIEKELTQVFQFYKHYFPNREVPDIYTYISEYAYGVFVGDGNVLGIGLDFFLGEDYPYYDPSYFPRYIKRSMDRNHLTMRAVEAVVNDLCGQPKGDRMLDFMVNNGKKLYLMDRLMPYAPDSIRLAYSGAQVEWCEENELQIWAYFLSEELLYSTSYKDTRKFIDHSPNSPGMPPQAPGRTGNWVGWQIIKTYMDRHPETSMEELIELADAQQILERSKYKP